MLRDVHSIPTGELLSLLDKHVFSYKSTDPKERAAANAAKIESLLVLHDAGRIYDLNAQDHRQILESVAPLVEEKSLTARLQGALSLVVPKLDEPLISLYGTLVSKIWKAARETDAPTAMQLLFMLRLQEQPKVISTLKYLTPFQVNDKSLIKRVVGAVKLSMQSSDESTTAAELVGKFRDSPTFEKLWSRIACKSLVAIPN